MKPVLGNIYHLSGCFFSQEILQENNNLFRLEKISLNGTFQFKGMTTHTRQVATVSAREGGSAIIVPVETTKSKHKKRTKGSRHTAPTVNKATIIYNGNVKYTVKDFVSLEVTHEKTVFIMEDNTKGTVNYRQAITVPNDDVVAMDVRGVTSQFSLDMRRTNMGIIGFLADDVEMETRSIKIKV